MGKTVRIPRLFVLLLAASMLLLAACSGPSKQTDVSEEMQALEGLWRASGASDYEFDGKGNGSVGHGSHKHAFTYSAAGDTLTIAFAKGDGHGTETIYTVVLEEDTLTLTDSKGNAIAYTRS